MLDKETLSQYKYVYYLHSQYGKIHIEQYPVVYINQEYVYYKRPGDSRLNYGMTSTISKSLNEALKGTNALYGVCILSKKLDKEVITKEVEEILKERAKYEKDKQKAKTDLEYAKKIYEHALEQYKKYEEA